MEKRRFRRITFTADAVVTWGTSTISAETIDLGLEGMYVRTPQRIPLNETVDVQIASETDPPCSISASAVVVRHDDQAMELAFRNMEFDSFFTLARLVAEGLGDQAKAAGELLDFLQNPPGDTQSPPSA